MNFTDAIFYINQLSSENYRLISIPPIFSKAFEYLIIDRMTSRLFNSDFSKKGSIITSLLAIISLVLFRLHPTILVISYLANVHQHVELHTIKLNMINVEPQIPQGSVLGSSSLYSYINYLYNSTE